MNEGVIKTLADNACELAVLFFVICVGLGIVVQAFHKNRRDEGQDVEE